MGAGRAAGCPRMSGSGGTPRFPSGIPPIPGPTVGVVPMAAAANNRAPNAAEMNVSCAMLPDEDIAVVRLTGRGNFQNSVPLKRFADHLQAAGRPRQFILDLGNCETMDSTFLGVLASVSIAQAKGGRSKVIIVHANDHVKKLLKTLGIAKLVEIHDSGSRDTQQDEEAIARAEGNMKPAESSPVSRVDQICVTLEAHKTLAKVDHDNELRFQTVIQYLEESLKNDNDAPKV